MNKKIFIISFLASLLSGCVVKGVFPKANTLMNDRLSNYCTLDSSVLKDCYAGSYATKPPNSYADADIHRYQPKVMQVPGLVRASKHVPVHKFVSDPTTAPLPNTHARQYPNL